MVGAQGPPPLASAFHPHLEFLAQSGGTWFKELTDKRLRRGVFTSVADLTQAITLGRALEQRPQTLHLESHRRRNHRKGLPRPRNPPPGDPASII